MLGIREGVIHVFHSKTFLSHSSGKFRREPVFVSQNFRYRKKLGIKGGEYQDFPSKTFCLRVPKKFIGEHFCAVFHKFFGIEKVYGEEGWGSIRSFRRIFFVSLCRKIL